MNTELSRQHEAHKARLSRLYRQPVKAAPPPPAPKLVEATIPYDRMTDAQKVAHLMAKGLTEEAALDVIHRESIAAPRKGPSVREIQAAVADHFGISVTQLCSAGRPRWISWPRQIAQYLCRELRGLSYPEIGRRFGGKDHTSVLHGARKVSRKLADDADFAADLGTLRSRIMEPYQ